MADDDGTTHELRMTVLESLPAGFTRTRHQKTSANVIATCLCGWESGHVDGQRAARRVFERRLRAVRKGGVDFGDRRAPDDRRNIIERHRQGTEARTGE